MKTTRLPTIVKMKVIPIAALTLLHFGLTVILFLADFSFRSSRFDTGSSPTSGERLLHLVTLAMEWPVTDPLVRWGGRLAGTLFPGQLGYIPMLLNSLVWGVLLWLIIRGVASRRRNRAQPSSEPPRG